MFFEDIFIQQIHPLYLFCVKAILLLFIPSTSNTVLAYDISFEFGWVGEKFKRYGTYVYLGLILINIWKKPILYCGVITLKLKINKLKKKRSCPCPRRHYILKRERSIKKKSQLKFMTYIQSLVDWVRLKSPFFLVYMSKPSNHHSSTHFRNTAEGK